MKNALVIRTYGDPETCTAIAAGMIGNSELQMVKAECAKLRAQNDIRAYGSANRFQAACDELAIKSSPLSTGRCIGPLCGSGRCCGRGCTRPMTFWKGSTGTHEEQGVRSGARKEPPRVVQGALHLHELRKE